MLKVKGQVRWGITLFDLIGLLLPLTVFDTQADAPFDDLTPNQYTFVDRHLLALSSSVKSTYRLSAILRNAAPAAGDRGIVHLCRR